VQLFLRITLLETNNRLRDTDGRRHLLPSRISIPFQLPEVYRGHREGGVVQEAADLLNRLTSLPPELGCRVAEDVDAGLRQPRRLEVSAKIPVERAAGDPSPTIGTGWPQRIVWLHGG